eukprot:12948402-Alexandrium_andersonii.AAC.1
MRAEHCLGSVSDWIRARRKATIGIDIGTDIGIDGRKWRATGHWRAVAAERHGNTQARGCEKGDKHRSDTSVARAVRPR